jgi:NADH:ubiquinone oxidoreductase subunit E
MKQFSQPSSRPPNACAEQQRSSLELLLKVFGAFGWLQVLEMHSLEDGLSV